MNFSSLQKKIHTRQIYHLNEKKMHLPTENDKKKKENLTNVNKPILKTETNP